MTTAHLDADHAGNVTDSHFNDESEDWMNWQYEEAPPNGGAGGEAFKSTFNGAGKKPAAILAREAVQNSVDAGVDPSVQVRVDFRFRNLSGDDRTRFLECARIKEMADFVDLLDCADPNCITHPDADLELLYIDDYETTGLKGDPTNPSSNLRKLLMELGGSPKVGPGLEVGDPNAPAAGGSYGFGKAVYSSSSRLGTIFAFSRTKDQNDNDISVLMGCAYQAGHEREGHQYTGRAWFGIGNEVPGRGVRFDPFINDDAEELAQQLGFDRDEGYGTSILIIDTSLHATDLIAGLEDYWWPRIHDGRLDATVITSDENEHVPTPRRRQHLQPFMNAFDIALGKAPAQSGRSMRHEFNRMNIPTADGDQKTYSLGVLGAVLISDDPEEMPFDEEHESKIDSVALIRGPHMVVDYHRNWQVRGAVPPAAGCFIAHQDVDAILRLAEPLEHDQWDPDSQRISKRHPELAQLVSAILNRLKVRFTAFQKDVRPSEPKSSRPLRQLERKLASWFGSSKPDNPPPPPNPAPISLRPSIQIQAVEGGLQASGEINIGVSRQAVEAGTESVPFRLRVLLKVKEEEGVTAADPVPLHIHPNDDNLQRVVEETTRGPDKIYWIGEVTRGSTVRLHFTSSPYDSSWTVQLAPEVEELRGENNE